jgi:RNA polymerase sigma-70 factor (ECF subfamily)
VVRINGYPGLVLQSEDGPMTLSFEPSADGRIAAIYIVRNPEKLRGLEA